MPLMCRVAGSFQRLEWCSSSVTNACATDTEGKVQFYLHGIVGPVR